MHHGSGRADGRRARDGIRALLLATFRENDVCRSACFTRLHSNRAISTREHATGMNVHARRLTGLRDNFHLQSVPARVSQELVASAPPGGKRSFLTAECERTFSSFEVKPIGRLVRRKLSFLIFRFIDVVGTWALRGAGERMLSDLFPLPSALRL